MPRIEHSSPVSSAWSHTTSTINTTTHRSLHHPFDTPAQPPSPLPIDKKAIVISSNHHHHHHHHRRTHSNTNSKTNITTSGRKSKNHVAMKSIKTTGSDRSARRAKRHSSMSSRSADNHFEMQHEHMLARQQFRTNTSNRGHSGIHHSGPKTAVVVINANSNGSFNANGGNGNHRSVHSLPGTDSYESGSGYSMLSRRSEQAVPPRTVQSKTDQDRKLTIHNVKTIISGKIECF